MTVVGNTESGLNSFTIVDQSNHIVVFYYTLLIGGYALPGNKATTSFAYGFDLLTKNKNHNLSTRMVIK